MFLTQSPETDAVRTPGNQPGMLTGLVSQTHSLGFFNTLSSFSSCEPDFGLKS